MQLACLVTLLRQVNIDSLICPEEYSGQPLSTTPCM